MEATELRIGNYVTLYTGDTIVDDCHQIIAEDFNEIKGLCLVGIKPITLTAEWLAKFGFQKYKVPTNDWMLNNIRIFSGHHEWWFGFELTIVNKQFKNEGVFDSVRLDYVHQLQNLYFALTGKEIKLKK